MNVKFAAGRHHVISAALQVWIRQQLPYSRYLREEVEESGRVQERNQLKSGFSKSYRGAQTVLREVSIVVVKEFVCRERWHFANQSIEQPVLKHVVNDNVRERLGRFIRCGHLLKALIDHDFMVQQRQDVNSVSVCHMHQNSPAPGRRRY